MNIITIILTFILVIATLIASAYANRIIARKLEAGENLYFVLGLLLGPIGIIIGLIFFPIKIVINKIPDKAFAIVITMLVFGVLSFSLLKTSLLDSLEWGATDFMFFLRDPDQKSVDLEKGAVLYKPNPKANKKIIILGIDEDTFRGFSDEGINWPYPWSVHSKFVDFVSSGNPEAILFDIMFLEHKPFEKSFAKSIKKAGNVFLDYQFASKKNKEYKDLPQRMNILNKVRFKVDPDDTTPQIFHEVVPPTPLLSKAAKGLGFANVIPGSPFKNDKVNRTMPLLTKYNGWYYPNIDLIVIMNYFGLGVDDVEVKIGKYIKLKNLPANKMTKPNLERSITIPIDRFGIMDVNYIGSAGSFQNLSYSYFYNDGTMEGNDSLKGKFVLVAAYNLVGISKDVHHSPYGPTFGIEHHANALNSILNQDFLYKMSELQIIILLFTIALVLGMVLSRGSIIFTLVFTGGLAIGYFIVSYLLFSNASFITPFATPMLQIVVTFILIISYRILNEEEEKKYIRQTFSKFVSKSVVDDLLKHPEKIKLGGEKKELTVLFSDIRGFTTISEKLSAEELVVHLNEYLQVMTEEIIKFEGTLDKYVGDEIMAFWGAPIPQENHALLACQSALDQMEMLHKLNERWKVEGKPPLNIGIGVNTGDMVVGNMGSSSRMDYTLMGDSVNLGARLEGTNKVYGTNIIISEYTYAHVKDHVIVRELDLVKVKGKNKPVRIYELIDMKE